jgi:hypothetical protein
MSAASAALHLGCRSVGHVPRRAWVYTIGRREGLGSPNCIENALGQVMVADRVGDAQVFKCESVVALNERRDELGQKISTPIGDVLVVSLQSGHRFPPVGIVLLPAGHLALKETSNSHINADLLPALRSRSTSVPRSGSAPSTRAGTPFGLGPIPRASDEDIAGPQLDDYAFTARLLRFAGRGRGRAW